MEAQLLDAILQVAAQNGCSDLHLRANQTAFGRGNGRVASIGGPVLTSEQIHALVSFTAGVIVQGNAEYSCERGNIRLRCTAFVERGVWGLTIRLIPLMIPTFADLRLPPVVKVLSSPRPGLVLVTGPTGSGKSTTAAAMLRCAGQEPIHILTLEDPVEHRITDVPACVTQREVPRERLGESLKDALRLDPDVIYIGEIRDAATLEVALHAAETGIAVLSTFHTHSAVHTIQRLSAMLPEGMSKERVAEAVRGVITQRLLRRRGSNGRVVATEVLVNNYTVKEALRDPAKAKTLPQILERSGDQGMHTLDQSLLALAQAGIVEAELAAAHAASPGNLRRALQLAAA